jgi:hypothetical protein
VDGLLDYDTYLNSAGYEQRGLGPTSGQRRNGESIEWVEWWECGRRKRKGEGCGSFFVSGKQFSVTESEAESSNKQQQSAP